MKLPTPIVVALEQTGMDWSAEMGKKHIKVRLQGRLCVVLSRQTSKGGEGDRMNKNGVAAIRRLARELQPDKRSCVMEPAAWAARGATGH